MAFIVQSQRFWATSSRWTSARADLVARQREEGTTLSKRAFASMVRSWDGRQKKRSLPTPSSPMGQTIKVDPNLSAILLEAINAAAPTLINSLDEHFGAAAFALWEDFPVATGNAKALTTIEYDIKGDKLLARFVSHAPYARFIRKGKPWRKALKVIERANITTGRDVLNKLGRLD